MRVRTLCAVLSLAAIGLAGCGTKTPTASVPAGTGHLASVSPDPSPSNTPGPSTSAGPAGSGGTLFYLSTDSSGGPTVLHGVIGGTVRTLATLPAIAYINANVSPDGRKVSWGDPNAGELMVANVDGTGKHDLTMADSQADGQEPVWTDAQHLVISRTDKRYVVDLATGTLHDGPKGSGIHLLVSAGAVAYCDGSGKVFVAKPDGSGATAIPGIGTGPAGGPRSFDLESLSPDGSRIVLDLHTGDVVDGDVARGLWGNTLVDTRTGAPIAMPTFQQALYLPGGDLLLRDKGTLTEVTPAGQTVRQFTEPAAAKNWTLLSYAPAG